MKMNINNLLMIIGIVPMFIMMSIMILLTVKSVLWFYTLLLIFLLANLWLIKKQLYIPRKLKDYGEIKKVEINLPVNGFEVFGSEGLELYDFLNRTVEVYSPLFNSKESKTKLIISEKKLNAYPTSFTKVALVRSYIQHKEMSTVKIVLRLVCPLLLAVNIALYIIWKDIGVSKYLSPFFVNMALPLILVILFLLHLHSWNKYISANEQQIDKALLQYFTVEEVVSYIREIERIEGRNEKDKSKSLNGYYSQQRINKIMK